MIDDPTVSFANGKDAKPERAKILDSGWVGMFAGDGWVYYPPRQIERISSEDGHGGMPL